MRPRVFPAEDHVRVSDDLLTRLGFNEAAGIPRGRHPNARHRGPRPSSFNEAAGIPRGRHIEQVRDAGGRFASMRPRVFPAEDIMSARYRADS